MWVGQPSRSSLKGRLQMLFGLGTATAGRSVELQKAEIAERNCVEASCGPLYTCICTSNAFSATSIHQVYMLPVEASLSKCAVLRSQIKSKMFARQASESPAYAREVQVSYNLCHRPITCPQMHADSPFAFERASQWAGLLSSAQSVLPAQHFHPPAPAQKAGDCPLAFVPPRAAPRQH